VSSDGAFTPEVTSSSYTFAFTWFSSSISCIDFAFFCTNARGLLSSGNSIGTEVSLISSDYAGSEGVGADIGWGSGLTDPAGYVGAGVSLFLTIAFYIICCLERG